MASKGDNDKGGSSEESKPFLSGAKDYMTNKALDESVRDFKSHENRDPNSINNEVRIQFEDIIAEPDGYHSSTYVWHMSSTIYNFGKDAAYQLVSFIFGIPLSLIWGCLFASVACCHVWCYSPLRRSHNIKMGCWKHFWAVIIGACFDPLFESTGKVFSNVNIRTEKNMAKQDV